MNLDWLNSLSDEVKNHFEIVVKAISVECEIIGKDSFEIPVTRFGAIRFEYLKSVLGRLHSEDVVWVFTEKNVSGDASMPFSVASPITDDGELGYLPEVVSVVVKSNNFSVVKQVLGVGLSANKDLIVTWPEEFHWQDKLSYSFGSHGIVRFDSINSKRYKIFARLVDARGGFVEISELTQEINSPSDNLTRSNIKRMWKDKVSPVLFLRRILLLEVRGKNPGAYRIVISTD